MSLGRYRRAYRNNNFTLWVMLGSHCGKLNKWNNHGRLPFAFRHAHAGWCAREACMNNIIYLVGLVVVVVAVLSFFGLH